MSSETSENDSSEEFYDAEDLTPNRGSTLNRKRNSKSGTPQTSSECATTTKESEFKFPEPLPPTTTIGGTAVGKTIPESLETRSLSPEDASHQLRNTRFRDLDSISEGRRIGPPNVLEVKSSGFGRQRFRDLRRCMQYDDDENPGHVLTPDSQNSSVEGIFPQQKSHPFRIIETDAMSVQSMVSLGKVGRILAGTIEPTDSGIKDQQPGSSSNNNLGNSSSGTVSSSSSSTATSLPVRGGGSSSTLHNISTPQSQSPPPVPLSVADSSDKLSQSSVRTEKSALAGRSGAKMIFHEPDVIASTKLASAKTTDSLAQSQAGSSSADPQSMPVAPPRRRKKGRKTSTSSSDQLNLNIGLSLPPTDKMAISTGDTSSLSSDRAGSVGSGLSVPAAPASNPSNFVHQRPSELALRDSTNDTISNSSRGIVGGVADALSRHSGNSSSSVNSTKPPSPSNSGKNHAIPTRGTSNSVKGIGLSTMSRDQLEHLDRFDRIRADIMSAGHMNSHSSSIGGMTVQRGASVGGGGRGHGPAGVSGAPGTGSNSLGSATKYTANLEAHIANVEKRRRSAGDEDLMKQMNVYLRTRTGSGKNLTDLEILSQVPVKNLDTGENFPLSAVEENIPGGTDLNPLSLHILRLTSHMEIRESDDESVCGSSTRGAAGSEITIPAMDDDEGEVEEGGRLRRKTAKLRRFFGSTMRKTVDKAKSIASEVSHARHKEDVADIVDAMNPEQNIKIKASSSNKGPYEFTKLQHVQDLGETNYGGTGCSTGGTGNSQTGTGAVWCMKFSSCGRLLATAGQDKVLKIWVLKDAYPFFQDMRTKYNAEQKASPTPSQESLVSHNSAEEALAMAAAAERCPGPFMPRAFCSYTGHTSDLLDVAWSKNYFILSSSMDKTVRLWHISRRECLCSFQHIDFVTAIAFHPRDDRFFLSGSLDGKLRLWNIPDKKVALYTELNGPTKLITAANFCQNGKFAVVGSYDGRCIFYTTDQLRYHTMVHVRSSRGRNKTARKISGIEPMPGEDKILVTSNDSRVRLYDLRDLNLSCKYKGFVNASSQIKASFSHDGKYIIAGSENQCIYVWKTHNDQSKLGSGLRRDRSDYWEGIKAHNATVTCAIFAPHPEAIIKPEVDDEITDTTSQKNSSPPDPMVEQHKRGCGYVMVSADYNGAIKIFINKTKPKHSSLPYTAILD